MRKCSIPCLAAVADIAAFRKSLHSVSSPKLDNEWSEFSEDERARIDKNEIDFARGIIREWKFWKDIQDRFGGAVYTTHMGWPLVDDAMDQFLRAEKDKGAFTIPDPDLEQRVLNAEKNRPGYYPMSEEAREALAKPWWTVRREESN
ncbi:MAG: hypothetical protein KJ626_06080 [Verrucomicrobia bacterium]|nr:hypothetical protein [Verrucomicrobiota bacterium]